ncbi:MAG: FAA hydrolase family protein, partial [Oxalobacteraceae bacterium]
SIYCIGLNYREHVEETGRTESEHPTVFLRTAQSQVGHGDTLLKPTESDQFDYEGEIAVIIGKPGRRIEKQHALEHVAGYACYNDGSARDWQAKSSQWTAGKNFPATGAFGPWMVPRSDIADRCGSKDTKLHGFTSCTWLVAIVMMSFKTPAAVTSEPAPGPVTISGFAL